MVDLAHKHPDRKPFLACFGSALWDSTAMITEEELAALKLVKGSAQHRTLEEQNRILAQIDYHNQKDDQKTLNICFSSIGGTSCNLVRHLAALGTEASFSTLVGADAEGERIKEALRSYSTLRAHIHESASGKATGRITVLVTPDGERTMLVDLGVNEEIDQAVLCVEDIMTAQIYHVCGYQWQSFNQRKAVRDALALSHSCGVKVSLDVADPLVAAEHKDDFLELIRGGLVNVVFANREEARLLFGENFLVEALNFRDHVTYVFKLGGDGAQVICGGQVGEVKARKDIQVLDTTGAGDVLAGGFLAGWLNGCSVQQSLELGNYLAGDVITRLGVQASSAALEYGKKFLASCCGD